MNCFSCGGDNPPDKKFCGDCGARLANRCAHCGAESPGDKKFCGDCGAALAHVSDSSVRSASLRPDPRAYTPKHLADRILQSKSALEGERKQVTVLFADVKGSMELAEQLDPEEWHTILERFFAILTEGVHRFEGTVNQYTGDGIMALFGAPIAHEEHAQRACYAALHLREAIERYATEVKREHGISFSTRMGINSGEVVVGRIGDDLRMDYTAQGHTVGLAQRMESLASPDTCYLTAATAALVGGYFALEDLGEFRVKGVAEPVRVHRLNAVGAARTRFDISRAKGLSRFVGRAADLRTLEDAVTQAAAGNGQVVGVVADAGTGKSRLCFEFLERCRARGMRVYEGHAVAHGKNIPLLPILEVFRAYFGITAQDDDRSAREKIAGRMVVLDQGLAESLPLLFDFLGVADPQRPAPAMSPEVRQRQIFQVMRQVIRSASETQPTVTLIEDLHWIDAASAEFLAQMVDAQAGTRSLLLVNFRPEYRAEWMQKSWYRQIPLTPLGREAIAELLADLLGSDESLGSLADAIHVRSGGNPFFAEEITQSLIESGQLQGSRGAYRLVTSLDRLSVPATVQAVLAARIDRLPEREKQLLQVASVIGKDFTEPLLEAVAGLPGSELKAALLALRRAEFLHEQAIYPVVEYAFKHPLTQEVALGSQLKERRRAVHATVARAIEQQAAEHLDEAAALLAHHWEEAGDVLAATRWHGRAAEWFGLNDTRAAMQHWLRVRGLVEGQGATSWADEMTVLACSGVLLLGGYRVEDTTLDWSRIFADGCNAAERLGDLASLARMQSLYARAIGMSGTIGFHVAEQHARDAVATADRLHDAALCCGTRTTLCHANMFLGHLEEAARAARETIDIAGNDIELGAGVMGYSSLIWALMFLEINRGYTADPAAAVAELPRLRRLAIDKGYPEMILWSAPHEAKFLRALHRDHDLRVLGGSVADVLRTPGGQADTNRVFASEVLFLLHASNGDWSAALDEATQALGLIRDRRTNKPFEAQVLANIACARLELGDLQAARIAATEGIECLRSNGIILQPGAYGVLARVQLALDEPAADIVVTLDEYAAVIARAGLDLYQGELAELRATLAERSHRDPQSSQDTSASRLS